MPKNSEEKAKKIESARLDKKDKEILARLYLDSRRGYSEIGKAVGLSGPSVERRIARLKSDEGIITLLFADVNLAKMGFKSYRLYFKFDVMDKKTEEDVLALFESYSRTVWGVICEGEYDVLWRIIAKDEFEVERAAYQMVEKFGSRIAEKTIIMTTYQAYLPWNKAFGTARSEAFPLERAEKIEMPDAKGMRLLSALYANSRESTVGLAKKISLTPDAVQYRMQKLSKNGFILGYTAWFDAKKLGFNYYKLLIGFRGQTKEKEAKFLRYCRGKDDVIYINKTIGSWDMELDIIVRNNEELHSFTREIKTRFGDIIGRHAAITAIEERMLNPLRGE